MTGQPLDPFDLNRREFLGRSAQNAAGVAAGMVGLSSTVSARSPGERVALGVVGVRRRGRQLAGTLAALADVDIASICDVDQRVLGEAADELAERQGWRPATHADFGRLCDDHTLDAIVIATPDHWHATMTRLACLAGKDVYVESPVTHSLAEARPVLETAAATGRIVQTGLEQRSGTHFQDAVAHIAGGQLGRVRLARAWTAHRQKSIGLSADVAAPAEVDYDAWLGPAPARPFNPNRFHHNWQWFWDYGSGALGRWGVHMLDLARWGLELDLPDRVSATGGTYHFQDDRETPDTLCVQYHYPDATILWEHRLWSPRGMEGRSAGVAFYGELGTLLIDRGGWKVYDRRESLGGDASPLDQPHLRNFVDSIKSRQVPAADLDTGITSSLLCHLGNAAYRLGRELTLGELPSSGDSDPEVAAVLAPPAREPWDRLPG